MWGKLVSANAKHPHVDLEKDEIYIGRNSDCHVSFPNSKEISGKHCRIFRDKDVVFVEDLSSNGTFVNGVKIGKGNKTTVRHGEEISLVVPSSFKALKSEQFAEKFIAYVFQENKEAKPETENCLDKAYDIRQELGSGNFATVKLGVNRTTGETVAVKIIGNIPRE